MLNLYVHLKQFSSFSVPKSLFLYTLYKTNFYFFNMALVALAVQYSTCFRILKLSSDRKLEDLKDKWWKNNPNKLNCPEAETESSGISVKNIAGVFLVILGGIVFSIVTLIFEYFCIKNKDSSKSENANKEPKVKKKKQKNTNMIVVKTLNST